MWVLIERDRFERSTTGKPKAVGSDRTRSNRTTAPLRGAPEIASVGGVSRGSQEGSRGGANGGSVANRGAGCRMLGCKLARTYPNPKCLPTLNAFPNPKHIPKP
eukprot:8694048-Pyramimonas_sp.AAC.1